MAFEATNVSFIEGYRLEVEFENGEKGTVDLSELARKGGFYARFADPEFFRGVSVNPELGVLTWPDGTDIAPEPIYHLATGKPLPPWAKTAMKAS